MQTHFDYGTRVHFLFFPSFILFLSYFPLFSSSSFFLFFFPFLFFLVLSFSLSFFLSCVGVPVKCAWCPCFESYFFTLFFLFYPYVLVCYVCVARMHWYVTRMLPVCIRMSSVCTRMYSYVLVRCLIHDPWKCLILCFMEDVKRRRRIFLSLSKFECGPEDINSREICLHLTFPANWNKRDKI